MSCYQMQIAKKSHKEVLDTIDKVFMKKKSKKEAATELGLTDHAFDELYADVIKHVIII